jgi:TolA-binding protein
MKAMIRLNSHLVNAGIVVSAIFLALLFWCPVIGWSQAGKTDDVKPEKSDAQKTLPPANKAKPAPVGDALSDRQDDINEQLAKQDEAIQSIENKIGEAKAELESVDKIETEESKKRRSELRIILKKLELELEEATAKKDELKKRLSGRGIQKINEKYQEQIEQLRDEERKTRKETIAQFEMVVNQDIQPEIIPNVLFRLAELYLKDADDSYHDAWDRYDEEMKDYDKQQILYKQGKRSKEPISPQMPARDYSKAIKNYKRIINDYPDFEQLDGAYYLLAYCLTESGRQSESSEIFNKMVELFPHSRFVPEAFLRRGEYYFDQDEMDKAVDAYKKVIEFTDSELLDKAYYKLGWAYYRKDQFEMAIDYFRMVVDYYAKRNIAGEEADNLKNEAIEYMAISFADYGGLDKLKNYFKKVGGRDYAIEIYKKLGDIYFDRSEYTRAIETYKSFLSDYPNHPDNSDLQKQIVDCYITVEDKEKELAERENYITMFDTNSRWFSLNKDNPLAVDKAMANLRNNIRYLSAYYHNLAVQKKDSRYYPLAIKNYRRFIDKFPDDIKVFEQHFFLAECLYYSDDFMAAAREYEAIRERIASAALVIPKDISATDFRWVESNESLVAKDKQLIQSAYTPKDENYLLRPEMGTDKQLTEVFRKIQQQYFIKAAYNAVMAYDKIYKRDYAPKTPKGQEMNLAVANGAMPEVAFKLISALQRYIELFPDDQKVSNFLFAIAEIQFTYRDFEAAKENFDKVIKKDPKSELAKEALSYIMESAKYTKDEKFREETAKKYESIFQDAGDRQIGSKLRNISHEAIFRQAQALEKEGKIPDAIAEYERLAGQNPEEEILTNCLYNIGLLQLKQEEYYLATDTFLRLEREHPSFKYNDAILMQAAECYEKLSDIPKALGIYEKIVRKYPNAQNYESALLNSGLLREREKDYNEAITHYRQFIAQYPQNQNSEKLTWSIAELYYEQKSWRNAVVAYEEFLRRFPSSFSLMDAYLKMAKAELELDNPSQAQRYMTNCVEVYERLAGRKDLDGRWAAEAKFLLSGNLFAEYMRVNFNVKPNQLQKTVNNKLNLLNKIVAEYKKVIGYASVDWIVAAYYRMGLVYKNMAESYLNAPLPEGLSPEEEEQYVSALQNEAEPFKKEAIVNFRNALTVAKGKRVQAEWVAKAYEELVFYEDAEVEPKFEKLIKSSYDGISFGLGVPQ